MGGAVFILQLSVCFTFRISGCRNPTSVAALVPVIPKLLHSELPNQSQLCSKERKVRDRQKRKFDSRHQARVLEPLVPGETVWLSDSASEGKVVENTAPRSYVVQTPTGQFRRNRRHIVSMPPV